MAMKHAYEKITESSSASPQIVQVTSDQTIADLKVKNRVDEISLRDEKSPTGIYNLKFEIYPLPTKHN